jgi:transcriptional regulator with XRE-family HTH domain
MSQRAAARTVGLPYTTLHGILASSRVPELPTLQKIAEGLKLPLARLQELAGFSLTGDNPKDDPLYGLTEEHRDMLRRLSPERKRALIDIVRQMLGE